MTGEPDDLEAAVRDGIITPAQAEAMRTRRMGAAPAAEQAAPPPLPPATENPARKADHPDEEPFRLIDNFGDVFLCVGLLILSWSPRLFGLFAGADNRIFIDLAFAALFWAIAEVLTGKRRRLPAVFSAILFAWMVQKAGFAAMYDQAGTFRLFMDPDAKALLPGFVALVAALIRFRWPFLLFCALLALIYIVFIAVSQAWDQAPALWILAGTGIAFLICGIVLDLKDRTRTGRWHEYALWFFVSGSPLTIHPLFIMLITGRADGIGSLADIDQSVGIVAGAAVLASFLGLLLDRRSLVASSMIYIAVSLGYVVVTRAPEPHLLLGLVPLIVGMLVIAMGLGWKQLRRWVMRRLPFQTVLSRLPAY